jgi:hypothetical protein
MLSARRLTWGEVAALVTLTVVAAAMFAGGDTMFSPGDLNARNRTRSQLGGVASHSEIGACSACHTPPWSRQTMADRCLDCHTDVRKQLDAQGPLHGMLPNGIQCRNCHTEHHGTHGVLTSFAQFDHDCAAFKLTGKHRTIDCKSCHVGNVYKGTAQTCASCHAEPRVHLGMFSADCAQCHSTSTWTFAALSPTGLGSFDHDRTAFPLTGQHRTVACQSCHRSDGLGGFLFKGTAQACASCHAEPSVPTVHKMRYGIGCAKCHTTSTWKGGVIEHSIFSITHHGKNNTCATCHNDLNNFLSFTCYKCHAHTAVKTERKHVQKGIVNAENKECMSCHGYTRRPRIVAAPPLEGMRDALAWVSPAQSTGQCPVQGISWRERLTPDLPVFPGEPGAVRPREAHSGADSPSAEKPVLRLQWLLPGNPQ